ncbi:MAG: PfkB family carbohydrate kinase [Planctomycetaceae bacterium]|nr:PfkB family carbohydrate kinase [Planctomycetaceae bacterium]
MVKIKKIITLGLSPAWDKTIEIAGINWNEHKIVSEQKLSPAGKALNINKALAWLGEQSIAAGLWGDDDFVQMQEALKKLKNINIKFTGAPGRTRENITIVDTKNKRQLHLRSKSTLANAKSMKMLKRDLQKIIVKHSFCIFAGAMPNDAIELVELAKKKGANVVVDSSGDAMKKIVAKGGLFLIKPNVEELSELIGRPVVSLSNQKEEENIIAAAKKILPKVKFILVSRGDKGAMLISNEYILSAKYVGKKYDVCNTVACGDYLLAGFISCFCPRIDCAKRALEYGIKSATAKAFGLSKKLDWKKINSMLNVQCSMLDVKI